MIRRILHVLVIVVTLVVGATAAAVIVSQTAWFKNWLRGYIVREANQYLNGTLSIERLGGNLFFGVEMENIALSMDGSQVVAVKDLGLDYNVFELIARGLSVDSIRLNKPVIYLRRDGGGWTLSRLVKQEANEADRSGPGKPIAIDAIAVSDGSVVLDSPVGTSGVEVPKRFDHLDAKLSFKYEPVRYSIEISHVSFRAASPSLALNALSGGVSVKDDTLFVDKLALTTAESSLSVDGAVQQYLTTPVLNLRMSSDKVSIPEIARVVPSLSGVRLQPSFSMKASGPLDRLNLALNVQSSAGRFSGTVVAALAAPTQAVSGSLSVRQLDLSAVLANPKLKSVIDADARFDLSGKALSNVDALYGDVELDSPRVAALGYVAEKIHARAQIDGRHVELSDGRATAYGAAATAAGRVTLPDFNAKHGAIAYDLHGTASHIDLRRLPRDLKVPPAATDVTAAYRAQSPASGSTSAATIAADVRFEPSTIAGARIAGGSTAGMVTNGADISYTADASVSQLDLRRIGREFGVPALAVDRYASTINGHVTAKGSGTDPKTLTADARGTITDTSILGGTIPSLDFDASLAHDTAHVTASGEFSGFDPAVAAGRPELKGTVAGRLDLDATVSGVSAGVTLDSVQAVATAALDESTIGGLAITSADVDGSYRDSLADIRALDVIGRDVTATASGTLALGDSGQSNLKVHANSPSLAAIGSLVDQPISGIATIDATVTGNKSELQANGTLTGGDVKYGDNGALTISSQFTARVPDLAMVDADVKATTHATFVSVGGQNVNEVDATTTYRHQQIDVDGTAKQPQRSASVGGSVVLHPDHQEVHLQRLALQSQGQNWQLTDGAPATINYAREGSVSVEQLTLVNGAQRISADGRFGRAGDALKVTLTDVDLAGVNALALRPPQFTGRLTASATISGTSAAPAVDGTFNVAQGGFQQFHYDSLGGTVKYAGAGVTLDTKLQQSPTTSLTAKGYVPTKLFTGAPSASAHDADTPAADRIDLHVESTPIDLGLVQGFTNAVTKVAGTLQANVDIGGTASDPHPTGTIALANGAFTVVDTGVPYTNLNGKIDLQADRIHIDNLAVLDNQKSALSVTGDLSMHEGAIGDVQLAITARDFKVVDSKDGNVRIDSDLQIAGELDAPRVEGDLAIHTGRIDLDRILARLSDSAYATEQTQYLTPETTAAPKPSPFDALQMDVHFTVPSDLVVKGSDLRAPGAPIGLGALNVTLGGDVWISKSPWDQVRLVGTVNTVRGTYDFQGRRFDIQRDGSVRFTGTDDFNPTLDVRTQRVIQAVTANVAIRGTLKQPEIVLTSTPPLEQADILALIVFNQPINQLGEGQQATLASRAQQLASGAVAGQLASSIGRVLGVDRFEISTSPDSGAAAQVTIGQQIGQNLYVSVQQDVGSASGETNVILEYELLKWLRLRTNALQGTPVQTQLFQRVQDSGIDLLFFFSY
jgi:hypothetical protein